MPERHRTSPEFIFSEPVGAVEHYLDRLSPQVSLTVEQMWSNAGEAFRFTDPKAVLLSAVAMHDEPDFALFLQQLHRLQNPQSPDFWVVLSCNRPQRMDGRQSRLYDQNSRYLHTFRQTHPEFPLTYSAPEYPPGTSIGAIHADLWDGALHMLYQAQTFSDLVHKLLVNCDADTSYLSPSYLRRLYDSYSRQPPLAGLEPLCLYAPVSHTRNMKLPNLDSMIAWFDLETLHGNRALSGHVALEVGSYVLGGGIDAADTTNEIWNLWERVGDVMQQSGGFKKLEPVPKVRAKVSPRRQYEQVIHGRIHTKRTRIDYDGSVSIHTANTHRSRQYRDISVKESKTYLDWAVPEILGELATAEFHRRTAYRAELTADDVGTEALFAVDYARRLGRAAVAILGGPKQAPDSFAWPPTDLHSLVIR